MPLRAASGSMRRRACSRVGLSLPGVPEANRQRFCRPGALPEDQVTVVGEAKTWERIADSGHRATYRFCPHCGSTITYVIEGWPGVIAIPLGAFADPTFPPPKFSVYEHRKHAWTAVLGDDVDHSSTPSTLRSPGTAHATEH